MAALDDLLARIQDVALRADLEREIAPLRGERELGLVFERHLPEKVRLPELTVRRGATVEVRDDLDSPVWQVRKVINGVAQLARNDVAGQVLTAERPVNDLIVVREFGQPIYPGLRSVGRVERGGDKPFHTVINAENYHALETLLYTYEGKVDCIYIDPPYNTGAKDWKYNNDYVDANDGYRHSKWLSFMEKRLKLAKRLLRPEKSVLIVTIDEKEYLRLGLLLEQTFQEARAMQMVSSVINPKGTGRLTDFSRTDEYIYFVFLGDAHVPDKGGDGSEAEVRWRYLRRTDIESARGTKKGGPAQFYPIYVNVSTCEIEDIGIPLQHGVDRHTVPSRPGCIPVFPIREEDEREMNWGLIGPSLKKALSNGFVRVSRNAGSDLQPFIFSYLTAPNIKKIEGGLLVKRGKRPDGSWIVVNPEGKSSRPTTVWQVSSHEAGAYGTSLLRSLIPGRKFPFPKSLYAVEDTLRLFLADNPNALVLDFFAGSGTTAHAVMRLNQEDEGKRRSILVTNNEVSAVEEEVLASRGLLAGTPEWEALGIAEYITWPRIQSAVTGRTPQGEPVDGEYKFTEALIADGLPENVEFFKLTYEDPDHVQLGHAFEAVAPLLWLKAGAQGPQINEVVPGCALPDIARYGVLFDTDTWPGFCNAIREAEHVTHAFVVTDSDAVFQQVAMELPDTVTPMRLYESYLTSFAINTGVRS